MIPQTIEGAAPATARTPSEVALLPGERSKGSALRAELQRLARTHRGNAVELVGADQHAALALSVHYGALAGGCA